MASEARFQYAFHLFSVSSRGKKVEQEVLNCQEKDENRLQIRTFFVVEKTAVVGRLMPPSSPASNSMS